MESNFGILSSMKPSFKTWVFYFLRLAVSTIKISLKLSYQHDGAVASTVASKPEGPEFKSTTWLEALCVSLC